MPRLLLLQTLCFSPIVDTSFGMDFCVCLESLRERIIRSKRLSFLCNFRKKGREEKHKILLYTINCALGYRLHTQSRDFYVWLFYIVHVCQLKNRTHFRASSTVWEKRENRNTCWGTIAQAYLHLRCF